MIKIQADISGDIAELQRLGAYPQQIRKAMAFAQQKALQAMRREAVEQTKSTYYVKAGKVRKAITVQNNSSGSRFIVRGKRMLISDYMLSPKKPLKRPKPLYGAVRRDSGMKSLGPAFLMRNGARYIPMMRLTRRSYPIKAVVAPAVPQLVEWSVPNMEEVASEALRSAFWEKVRLFMNTGKFKGG